MDWVESKVAWFLGVFGVSFLGGVFGLGGLFRRVKHLESEFDKLDADMSVVKSKQDEMIGYLKSIDTQLGKALDN